MGGTVLEITFSDGSKRRVDIATRARPSGVFAELHTPGFIAAAVVNPDIGTIEWPSGADLSPEVLYAAEETKTGSLRSLRCRRRELVETNYHFRMTTEELRKVHQAQPFRPFVLKMAGGGSIPVDHPEMMAYTKGARTTVVYLKDGNFEIVDLLLVESIEVRASSGRRRSA